MFYKLIIKIFYGEKHLHDHTTFFGSKNNKETILTHGQKLRDGILSKDEFQKIFKNKTDAFTPPYFKIEFHAEFSKINDNDKYKYDVIMIIGFDYSNLNEKFCYNEKELIQRI